jgi:hypothetical protein
VPDWGKALRDVQWRDALPPRWGWLRLIASPSSYILLIGLILIVWAKARAVFALEGVGNKSYMLLWATTADVIVHVGLATLFALGEARVRWLIAVTIPLATIALALAFFNAAYLSVAGEQLSWEAIQYGIESWDALKGILSEHIEKMGWLKLIVGVLFAVGIPLGVRKLIVYRTGEWSTQTHSRHRAHCAGVAVLVAGVMWLALPEPSALTVRQLGGNATVRTYWAWLMNDDAAVQQTEGVEFMGFVPPLLADPDAIASLAERDAPNVVVIILESTRFDHTSVPGSPAVVQTPHIASLAERGSSASRARAVVPHTTKSVFSILCGRMPTMQRVPVEVAETIVVDCLPEVVRRAGFQTAFFQSALGAFEHRPRLVSLMGFDHYEAWEDIGGQPLGYLASDDETLGPAFESWLDARDPNQPFMSVLLTSAPHHPYRVPAVVEQRAAAAGAPTGSDADRFARLVEAEDILVGSILEALEARGLTSNTIVVVAGDHGEGFGAKGVRQHDNNFYEEGLHVPLVMAGPGVPNRVIDGNASLVDITPTLMSLLGVPIATVSRDVIDGFDLLAGPLPDVPRWFGCYYEGRCRGFVLGDRKVVHIPERRIAFYFDLAVDPDERDARPLSEELTGMLEQLHRAVDSRITRRWPLDLGQTRSYGQWRCEPQKRCAHPKSPAMFFEQP